MNRILFYEFLGALFEYDGLILFYFLFCELFYILSLLFYDYFNFIESIFLLLSD